MQTPQRGVPTNCVSTCCRYVELASLHSARPLSQLRSRSGARERCGRDLPSYHRIPSRLLLQRLTLRPRATRMCAPKIRSVSASATNLTTPLTFVSKCSSTFTRPRSATRALVQVVSFNYCDPGHVIHTTDNGSVIAGHQISHNRRFQIVRRRYACRDDFCFLIGTPVVIGRH